MIVETNRRDQSINLSHLLHYPGANIGFLFTIGRPPLTTRRSFDWLSGWQSWFDAMVPLKTCELCGKPNLTAAGYARHKGSGKCEVAATRGTYTAQSLQQHQHPANQPINDLPTQLVDLHKSSKLISRIPKRARPGAAEVLLKIVSECTARNDAASWAELLSFAHSAFSLPAKRGDRKPAWQKPSKATCCALY